MFIFLLMAFSRNVHNQTLVAVNLKEVVQRHNEDKGNTIHDFPPIFMSNIFVQKGSGSFTYFSKQDKMGKREDNLLDLRTCLKYNLFHKSEFIGHVTERNQVQDLIQSTVKFGESNSALLIGPKSSGKTTLVNDVINELKTKASFKKDSIVVKLHGMIHTDDRLALKSITSQMHLENVVDGKVFGTFAENLSFLLACLRTGERHSSKSVVFILEEFDLFCFHHNQTLLYNLFDISQSAQAPICILGITCRLDVIELLEKRVKSRFSHRQIFLFPTDNEKSLDYALEKLKYYLIISKSPSFKIHPEVRNEWNLNVQNFLTDKKFKNIIQRLVDLDMSERTLKNILINIIYKLKEESLKVDLFQEEINILERDDILVTLQDLNVLELCLLIAMKHHSEIYEGQSMNFEMVFSRYMKFVKTNSNLQSVPRSVVMKALEHLQSLELISMISGGGGTKTQKEYQFFNLLVMPLQINEAVKKTQGLPTEVVQWSSSSYA